MGAKPVSYTKWDSDVTGRELPPPSLAGYKILGEIGRGSMGFVYEAKSDKYGPVAVKVLNILAANGDMAVERFRREVTVGARIGHAAIPTVYDSGSLPDGRFYLVMELLRGCDLEDWWEAPGHTRAEALDLICEALEPLAAAHEHGVVHRDLKPENLFVEQDGTVRLLDFGVARDPDASQNLRTATGISVGTPVYMSPEQATKPTEVDTPADIWSVGIMLYEALCGELPFDGESPHAVILHACTREPTPLEERVPEVHQEIRDLVNQCLRKNPLERLPHGGALHSALAALLQREDIRETLGGPAAAPSFRLSHSTAPTQLKQAAPVVPPLARPRLPAPSAPSSRSQLSLDSTGEIESLAPAPSFRKVALFALVGLAAAAIVGVSVARMNTEVAVEDSMESAETPESPTAFAGAPESPEPVQTPVDLVDPLQAEADQVDLSEEAVEDALEEDEAPESPIANAPQPTRPPTPVRPLRANARDDEEEESPEPVDPPSTMAPVDMAPETETAQRMEPVVVEPTPMIVVVPRPPSPPVATMTPRPAAMRPTMRTTMRTQPTEMRPERPGFVTF